MSDAKNGWQGAARGSLLTPNEPLTKTVKHTWNLDFACRLCKRYGSIPIVIAGQGMIGGKPHPDTDDEGLLRKLHAAHRQLTSGLCVGSIREFLMGEMWRHERTRGGGTRLVLMTRKDSKLEQKGTYKWPPWQE